MYKRTFDSGRAVTMLCASLVLSACGGGGSGSSSSSGGDTSTLKAGLYEAKIEYVDGKPTQNATAFLSPTGKFAVVYGGDAGVSIGKFSFEGTRISGTSNDYRQVGPEGFIENKGTEEGTINGTIRSQTSATFSTSDSAGEVNTNVTLQRQNSLSDLGISLKRASGIYVKGDSEVALTVGEDGTVDSHYYTDTTKCQLLGIETLSVHDTSINVFDISYTMTLCTNEDRRGEYSGIGFVGPAGEQMVFASHNGRVAMKFQGTE
ncbi:hypothetical protein [Marinobacter sp. SS13-12]|uniref:hypothetical protein n=1 Tax=Marinobacter sp. SS13-12 TaxID=3050451 RepID=UPI002553D463|nr:hypothetical protein [Marinobacter sp. SS13-12]MDK8463497.1 hypothetical protein [Marinobacter sp. SS13-12]